MSDAYIGEIRMFAGDFAPNAWALCNGQFLSIQQYRELYAIIGITFGGDGVSTFAVPDLRGRAPLHQGQGLGLADYVLGKGGGSESVTLTVANLPSHSHLVVASDAVGTTDSPGPSVTLSRAAATTAAYATNTETKTLWNLHGSAVGPQGGSAPHNNLMPSVCVNFIIALAGDFPQSD